MPLSCARNRHILVLMSCASWPCGEMNKETSPSLAGKIARVQCKTLEAGGNTQFGFEHNGKARSGLITRTIIAA